MRRSAAETAETDEQEARRKALDRSLSDYERRGFQIESRTNTQAVVVRWPGIFPRGYGMRRSRLRGHEGARSWVGWAILAYNLDTLAVQSG